MSVSMLATQLIITRPPTRDFTTLIGIEIGAAKTGVELGLAIWTNPKSILSTWSKISLAKVLVWIE